jgi:hypothetical protein
MKKKKPVEESKQAKEDSAKEFMASIGAGQNADPVRKEPEPARKEK